MSKWIGALAALAILGACAPREKSPINAQDMADYNRWLAAQNDAEDADAFVPIAISVSATGRVKAVPDIAIISGTITKEADFDHQATDKIAKITNAVQDAISEQNIELNFTDISFVEKRSDDCLAFNRKANARHNEINRDNAHNRTVKYRREQGQETSMKYKAPKKRIAQKVCNITHIEASISFTARVKTAENAGDIITRFTNAGVNKVDLLGYDFSSYDALYKQAGEKAVQNAKDKGKMIARVAGTELTELVGFSISAPERVTRLGPQAMIISNHGNRASAGGWRTVTETVVVQEASTQYVTIPVTYETVRETVVVQEAHGRIPAVTKQISRRVVKTPASTQERVVPAVTKQITRRVRDTGRSNRYSSGYGASSYSSAAAYSQPPAPAPAMVTHWDGSVSYEPIAVTGSRITKPQFNVPQNNALRMTMLGGPQTVTVTAHLQYLYDTPINGTVVPEDD